MKKINVPLHVQAPGSIDCGPACVQMLLDHFQHKQVSLDELKAELDYNDIGTDAYQNGSLLIHHGLHVAVVTANPLVFPGDRWDELTTDAKVRTHVQALIDDPATIERTRVILKSLVQFIDDGGHITVKIPDFADIKTAIDRDAIVGALNYTQPLGAHEGTYHFVLVTGYDNDKVFINNPWPESQKQAWFPVDKFLFAVHASASADADNGSFLVVSQ